MWHGMTSSNSYASLWRTWPKFPLCTHQLDTDEHFRVKMKTQEGLSVAHIMTVAFTVRVEDEGRVGGGRQRVNETQSRRRCIWRDVGFVAWIERYILDILDRHVTRGLFFMLRASHLYWRFEDTLRTFTKEEDRINLFDKDHCIRSTKKRFLINHAFLN